MRTITMENGSMYYDEEFNSLIIAKNLENGNVSVFTPCTDWDITFRLGRPQFFTTVITREQFNTYISMEDS
jgi:hypothetical protein